jgi:hypothetical protein
MSTSSRSRPHRSVLAVVVAAAALAASGAPVAAADPPGDEASPRAWMDYGPHPAAFVGASEDGSRVFFTTDEQLVPADTDPSWDIYERSGGTTTLLSGSEVDHDGPFYIRFLSSSNDGAQVLFETDEPLVAADTDTDVDIYERSGGTTTLVTSGGGHAVEGSHFPVPVATGGAVFFQTRDRLLAADTDTAIDVYERAGGTTTLVSIGDVNGNGPDNAFFAGASLDGTKVFFGTSERLVATDADTRMDVYERAGGTTTMISVGEINGNAGYNARFGRASLDGTRVLFSTNEPLVAADTDANRDIYERSGGVTTLLSGGAVNGNGPFAVDLAGASGDLSRVFFTTQEQLAATDTDDRTDIYEHAGSATTLVSAGAVNGNGRFDPRFSRASDDGTIVFFTTSEQLVAADTDLYQDVYQRSGGTTTRVSSGAVNGNGPADAVFRGASNDGTRVFFSTIERLTANDTDSARDVYERSGGSTTRVTIGDLNGNGRFHAAMKYCYFWPACGVSDDGTRVFFGTAERLVAADTDGSFDIYERSGGTTTLISRP